MRASRFVGAVAAMIALSACGGGISVQTDYDPGVDFNSYSTFAVLDRTGEGSEQLPTFVDARVKSAIADHLTSKGWRQVDSPSGADAAVGYQFTTDERSSYSTVNTGWGGYGYGGYGGWYGSGMSVGTSQTTERRYEVGTLVVAVFDVEQEAMIYTATGSKTLDSGQTSPEESQRRIDEAIQKIMADFPPGG